jgi:hypothetical protein
MKSTLITFAVFATTSLASVIPFTSDLLTPTLAKRASCDNTATSRSCWGDYSTDTDFYTVTPDTGVTREVCNYGN